VLSQSDRLRRQLLALVDADAAAYTNLMQAYRLPKGDEARNAGRHSAIQEALRHAVDIPLATAEACVQVLNLAALAVEHGNENAAADAAVGALLAHAAMLGGIHDVRANLRKINDTEFCVAMEARAAGLVANGEAALKRALG